jgi:hypothetical protein
MRRNSEEDDPCFLINNNLAKFKIILPSHLNQTLNKLKFKMKTKIFLLSSCIALFILSSCSHGPSAETKAKVAAFDSAWTAMGSVAKAAEDSINACVTMCESCCKAGDAMECCEHMKKEKDSLMSPCKNDMMGFEEMKKSWDSQKPMWDSLMTKFAALKEKAENGKGTDKEINDGLAELQAAMDNGNKGLMDGMSKMNEMKATCMKNMNDCKAGWANAKCSDKKCDMGKKMGDMKMKKS